LAQKLLHGQDIGQGAVRSSENYVLVQLFKELADLERVQFAAGW